MKKYAKFNLFSYNDLINRNKEMGFEPGTFDLDRYYSTDPKSKYKVPDFK